MNQDRKLPSGVLVNNVHSSFALFTSSGTITLVNEIKLFFFVPQTSIDTLSSKFYAEFRYVYRIFLSVRVSKIQRNLNVQNSTLCAHKTDRKFPLKCRGV